MKYVFVFLGVVFAFLMYGFFGEGWPGPTKFTEGIAVFGIFNAGVICVVGYCVVAKLEAIHKTLIDNKSSDTPPK